MFGPLNVNLIGVGVQTSPEFGSQNTPPRFHIQQ